MMQTKKSLDLYFSKLNVRSPQYFNFFFYVHFVAMISVD